MNSLINWSGPFHPVLVHLPIGFLILAVVFQWMATRGRYAGLAAAIRVTYLFGLISAVISCLTGLALSSSGDYDASTLQFHKWFGITVAVIALAGYLLAKRPFSMVSKAVSAFMIMLIIITGHFGGTLTHGEGFLTKGLAIRSDSVQQAAPIANMDEAIVFKDIIQPILKTKCNNCHGGQKQKGGLRLDDQQWIVKGGKDGLVFHTGDAAGSELYHRIVLDPLEEKHMPPKGKPQLTEQEVNLIQWWINSHADFDRKVKEVDKPAAVTAALLAMQSRVTKNKAAIPTGDVAKADEGILEQLRKSGIAISQVAVGSNYLQASLVSVKQPDDQLISTLVQVSKQLVWLRAPGAKLSVGGWKQLASLQNLTRLSIEHSNISDTTLPMLTSLSQLGYLNLVGTTVSVKGVEQLAQLKQLGQLYLGQTMVKPSEIASLHQRFPGTVIDSGNYQVLRLVTDTQLLKAPPVKK
jgi:uncharacterized membrane protein